MLLSFYLCPFFLFLYISKSLTSCHDLYFSVFLSLPLFLSLSHSFYLPLSLYITIYLSISFSFITLIKVSANVLCVFLQHHLLRSPGLLEQVTLIQFYNYIKSHRLFYIGKDMSKLYYSDRHISLITGLKVMFWVEDHTAHLRCMVGSQRYVRTWARSMVEL